MLYICQYFYFPRCISDVLGCLSDMFSVFIRCKPAQSPNNKQLAGGLPDSLNFLQVDSVRLRRFVAHGRQALGSAQAHDTTPDHHHWRLGSPPEVDASGARSAGQAKAQNLLRGHGAFGWHNSDHVWSAVCSLVFFGGLLGYAEVPRFAARLSRLELPTC